MITAEPIPGFIDNYFWLLTGSGNGAAIVDPGDAEPVQRVLAQRGLRLEAILLTHHHGDHIGGVEALALGGVPVYGPLAEQALIAGIDHPVKDGDRVDLAGLGLSLEVIGVAGHTRGHIAYYAPGAALLLCGDTLFAAGCGRLFEGTPAQMYASLQRLAALPPDTRVCCAHEYTLSNLAFARAVEPQRPELEAEVARVRALRAQQQPSLPSTIAREREINPFLRCNNAAVRSAAERHAGETLPSAEAVFAALRRWKDSFRAPAV
jgi:hydroxyacylglutathione hydrolase